MNHLMLSFLILGLILSTSSCKKDGDLQEWETILGTYGVAEACGNGTDSYAITIAASDAADNTVTVRNLFDAGETLNAIVNKNTLTIPDQTQTISYSGNGIISENTLTINFSVSAQGATDNCTAVCTRQ